MTIFSKLCDPFTDEDINLLRVLKLITSTGRDLMYQIFQYGCTNKDPHITLKEYLITHKNMTEAEYKKIFNDTTMRKKIIENPSCELFDVPLMLRSIKVSCDHMADKDSPLWFTQDQNKLEYLLTCLKNERNKLVHELPPMDESEMHQKIDELRDLLINIVERACDKFNIDFSTRMQKVKKLKNIIECTRKQPLTKEQIEECCKQLRLEHGIKTLKSEGSRELEKRFNKFLNPVSYVEGYDTNIDIDEVFIQVPFKLLHHINKNQSVSYKEILNLIDDPTTLSQQSSVTLQQGYITSGQYTLPKKGFIMIIGPPGSGKSTLVQKFMNEWIKSSTDIYGLCEYDIILPVICHEQHCKSLAELLEYLMPNTCAIIGNDITTYALNLRLLIVIDGIEEFNDNSRKLVQELLYLCKHNHHTIMCTCRPEELQTFIKRVPSEYKKIQLEMSNVPSNMLRHVIMNYHDQLQKICGSHQNTASLIQYVDSVSLVDFNFCKSFNNLLILIYLWEFGAIKSSTTITELYIEVNKMLEQRIIQRLLQQDTDGNLSVQGLQNRINTFMEFVYIEALLNPSVSPQPLSEQNLRQKCKDEKYFDELVSTYLMRQLKLTSTGIRGELCFPCHSINEFYAAKGLFLAITNKELYNSLLQLPKPNTKDEILPLTRYIYEDDINNPLDKLNIPAVLKHLTNLISIQNDFLVCDVAKEIKDIFQMIGITNIEKFVTVIKNTRFSQQNIEWIVESYWSQEKDITITDDNISYYNVVLPHISPKHVSIRLDRDPDDHHPHLENLLKLISEKDCNVGLQVWNHYTNPQQDKTTYDLIRLLLHPASRCRLWDLMGHLSGNCVPELDGITLEAIGLSIIEDIQASALTSGILQCHHKHKALRVMPNVNASSLTPLPEDKSKVILELSHLNDAEHVTWAGQVASKLASKTNRLYKVYLPKYTRGPDVGFLLIQELKKLNINVDKYVR